MGLYTVTAPCMVGDLHYAQVPTAPIEVDDTVAAALVAAGDLTPVGPAPTAAKAAPSRRRTGKGS